MCACGVGPVALAPARTPSAHASVHTERPTTPPTGDPPWHGQRQRPAPARPPLHLRLLFLIVYALHNAWNCWTFLNFSNFEPAKALLAATDEQIGFITTVGWLGICSTLPVVALCSWQRALLIVACLANALAPVVRYFAASACYHDGGYDALACSYTLVALSNYVQGAAFGVLGAWPSLLGAQWPQERATLVTAISSLANYVGGAAATLYMPTRVTTAGALLRLFRQQAVVGAALALLSSSFLRMPPHRARSNTPIAPPIAPPEDAGAGAGPGMGAGAGAGVSGLRAQLRHIARRRAPLQIATLGLLVGLSLVLQGMLPFVLAGVGFTDVQSGTANALYQLAAALVGTLLGGATRTPRQLRLALRALHLLTALSSAAVIALCWRVHADTHAPDAPPREAVHPIVYPATPSAPEHALRTVEHAGPTVTRAAAWGEPAVSAMLLLLALLGGSLLGALPFCLQQCALACAPAGENLTSALLYAVAMPVAAGLTQLCSSVPPLQALALLGSLLALELLLYFACEPPGARGCCRCARAKAAARVRCNTSHAPGQQALRQALLDGKHAAHVSAVDPRTEAAWGLSSNIRT